MIFNNARLPIPRRSAEETQTLQGEHQKAGEGRILPAPDQITFLQLQVNLILFIQVEQDSIRGGFTSNIFVPSKRGDDRFPIQHQVNLDGLTLVDFNDMKTETVNSFPWGYKDRLQREKIAHIY